MVNLRCFLLLTYSVVSFMLIGAYEKDTIWKKRQITNAKLRETIKIAESENIIATTWTFTGAGQSAWEVLTKKNGTPVDAVLEGCSYCERTQCDFTVGFGGSPDENGETTLDAMLFDGDTMRIGSVGSLHNIKNAIRVAQAVALYTNHTILIGQAATDFALKMGFTEESLTTNRSEEVWENWRKNGCQPNFWKNVQPDPQLGCGPYKPLGGGNNEHTLPWNKPKYSPVPSLQEKRDLQYHHDTIGQIAMNIDGSIAVGTSSNGAQFKIPGRMGDAPIPGAGGYANKDIGAAVATGDGDTMMRFAPSALIVERMRTMSPAKATASVINDIRKAFPNFTGAVLALNKKGHFSAACNGMDRFPFSIARASSGGVKLYYAKCISNG